MAGSILKRPAQPLKVPAESKLKLFHSSKKTANGPCLEDLELDLAGNSLKSEWNKRVAYLFAKRYQETPDLFSQEHDNKAVEKAFWAHLPTLKAQYIAQQRSQGSTDSEYEEAKVVAQSTKAAENRRRGVRLYTLSFVVSACSFNLDLN